MTDFATFWQQYPRRKAKGLAKRAWDKAVTTATPEDIMAGLQANLADLKAKEPQYQPHPATWLNQERWEDEPDAHETPLYLKAYEQWTDTEKHATARSLRNGIPAANMRLKPDIEERLRADGYFEEQAVRLVSDG